MFKAFFLAVPALCLAAPSIAQTDVAKPKKAPKICHSVVITGSRLPNQVCHTATEWDAINSGVAADVNNPISRTEGTVFKLDPGHNGLPAVQ